MNDLASRRARLSTCSARSACNPFPLFQRLRREDPVHWCRPMNLWLVTRYEDASKGLQDARLSSNRAGMYDQALAAGPEGPRAAPARSHLKVDSVCRRARPPPPAQIGQHGVHAKNDRDIAAGDRETRGGTAGRRRRRQAVRRDQEILRPAPRHRDLRKCSESRLPSGAAFGRPRRAS